MGVFVSDTVFGAYLREKPPGRCFFFLGGKRPRFFEPTQPRGNTSLSGLLRCDFTVLIWTTFGVWVGPSGEEAPAR